MVLTIPETLSFADTELDCYAVPLHVRRGGLLLAIPLEVLSDRLVRAGANADDQQLFGPSTLMRAELVEETEEGSLQSVGTEVEFLVIDAILMLCWTLLVNITPRWMRPFPSGVIQCCILMPCPISALCWPRLRLG